MAHVFARGTAVFDYWLAHPEGLTVRPLNARVERALGPAPFQPAVAVVVRAPSGRLRRIPAEEIVAVDPANEELFLGSSHGDDPVHEHVARAAGRAARLTAAGAAWSAPRAAAGARWFAECLVLGARVVAVTAFRVTRASALWLTPRAVLGYRRAVEAGRAVAARRSSL